MNRRAFVTGLLASTSAVGLCGNALAHVDPLSPGVSLSQVRVAQKLLMMPARLVPGHGYVSVLLGCDPDQATHWLEWDKVTAGEYRVSIP